MKSFDYIGSTFDGIVVGVPVKNARKEIHRDHGMVSGVNSNNWRYISSKNIVLWNTQPIENDKIKVDVFLEKRGIKNCMHKNMYNENVEQVVEPQQNNTFKMYHGGMNMKYTDFYLYLSESRDSDDSDYNAAEDFLNRRNDQLHNIIDSFIESNGKVRILWKTVPASLITGVWLQFGKYNKIDINKFDKIADRILTNIARLQAATDIAGHSNFSVEDELKDEGYNLSEKQWNDLSWYVEDYISDYGLEPLKKQYIHIFNAKSPEEQLYAIDKALNIIHQRNDLAAMFIEGGTSTLLKIASQGGYSSDSN